MVTKSSYRREYDVYLGAILTRDIHVHHIDHDRDNNDFSNLVAIPSKLHGRYHFLEREYQFRCWVLKYKRPRQKTIEKFSYANYVTGEWRNLFRGSANAFLNMSQSLHYLISDYEAYDKAKADYIECKKQVFAYKKQQSKRA